MATTNPGQEMKKLIFELSENHKINQQNSTDSLKDYLRKIEEMQYYSYAILLLYIIMHTIIKLLLEFQEIVSFA